MWVFRNVSFLFSKFEFLMKWETAIMLVKSAWFFCPVKIGLWRTSPPSPPLCAALNSSMLGLKLIHVSKRDTWNESLWCWFLKWSEFGFCIIPLEVVAKNFIAICIPWVSNWDMSRYLAIIKVLQKFVLISNNYTFLKIISFCILVLYQNYWVAF